MNTLKSLDRVAPSDFYHLFHNFRTLLNVFGTSFFFFFFWLKANLLVQILTLNLRIEQDLFLKIHLQIITSEKKGVLWLLTIVLPFNYFLNFL